MKNDPYDYIISVTKMSEKEAPLGLQNRLDSGIVDLVITNNPGKNNDLWVLFFYICGHDVYFCYKRPENIGLKEDANPDDIIWEFCAIVINFDSETTQSSWYYLHDISKRTEQEYYWLIDGALIGRNVKIENVKEFIVRELEMKQGRYTSPLPYIVPSSVIKTIGYEMPERDKYE